MNYRDAKAYKKCLTCDNKVLPPRRKCNSCRKSKTYTVTSMKPSRKGYNARGTALHRPESSHTRKPKRQNSYVLGSEPHLVMSRWDHV
jgi:uncharacterized OB-fold protein